MHYVAEHKWLIRLALDGHKTETTLRAANTQASFPALRAGDILAPARPDADRRIGVYEGLCLVAGTQAPAIARGLGRMADSMDTGHHYGAYGPRARPFLPALVQAVQDEPGSRRLVVPLYRGDDLLAGTGALAANDVPCTLAFVFARDAHVLNMTAVMRSQDLWWGLTYDAVQFSMLLTAVAAAAALHPGRVTIPCVDSHVYEQHVLRAAAWANDSAPPGRTESPLPELAQRESWQAQVEAAGAALVAIEHGVPLASDAPWLDQIVNEWHDA